MIERRRRQGRILQKPEVQPQGATKKMRNVAMRGLERIRKAGDEMSKVDDKFELSRGRCSLREQREKPTSSRTWSISRGVDTA